MSELGTLLDEITFKVRFQEMELWERKLRLYIRPRPSWMPEPMWRRLVALVFLQTEERP